MTNLFNIMTMLILQEWFILKKKKLQSLKVGLTSVPRQFINELFEVIDRKEANKSLLNN